MMAYPYVFGDMNREQREDFEALIEKAAKD